MMICLTIAGSDSGGGAGIQADLKTFHQFGVFGTSVVTAITAQNTVGVRSWEPVSPRLVRDQLDAVVEDIPPSATKSGMLGSRAVALAVAEGIATHRISNYVLDPVMVASSGDVLLDPDAISAVRDELVPLATLVTPNLHEAALLLGAPVVSTSDMMGAAEQLVTLLGARAALVKGGHADGAEVIDVMFADGRVFTFTNPRLATTSTHGTGCTLSAAIAAGLALGATIEQAVETAIDFVHRAIREAPRVGSGRGPLSHFVLARETATR